MFDEKTRNKLFKNATGVCIDKATGSEKIVAHLDHLVFSGAVQGCYIDRFIDAISEEMPDGNMNYFGIDDTFDIDKVKQIISSFDGIEYLKYIYNYFS